MQEAADYVGVSQVILVAMIERLAFRGYLELEFGKPVTAVLSPQADPVLASLDQGLWDLENCETEGMTDAQTLAYEMARSNAVENLRKRLER